MISARCPRATRPLALQAKSAARRLVLRRKVGRSISLPWHRVTLHWRRRRSEPRSARTGGQVRLHALNPQFHLYFPARSAELLREMRVLKSVETALLQHTQRIVLDHCTVRVRELASRLQVRRASLPRPDVDRKGDSTVSRRRHSQMPAAALWPATTAWLVSRKQRPGLEQRQNVFLVHTDKRVDTLRHESHTSLHERELQILRFRNLGTRDAVSGRKQEKAPSIALARTPELVWRKTQPVASSERAARPVLVTLPEQAETRSVRQLDVPQQTVIPSGHPSGAPLEKIDPRVLDQLTDKVIHQVERRIRIERERRGL